MTEDKQEFSPQFGNCLQMHQRRWQVLLWASPWPLPKYCCVVPLETRSSSFERPTEASWPGSYYLQNAVFISCPWLTLQALAQVQRQGPMLAGLLSQTFSHSHTASYHGGTTGGQVIALQNTGISHGSHTGMYMSLPGGCSCWEGLPVEKQ